MRWRVLEDWTVIDRWWTDTPVKTIFAHVDVGGRELIFTLRSPDRVWRIHGPAV